MSMNNILPEKDGSIVNVYNILEYSPYAHKNDCNSNMLFIVYRDEKGEKKVKAIKDPPYEFYIVKPEFRNDFLTPREYLEIDKCDAVKVPATRVLKRIYDEICESTDRTASYFKKIYNNAYQTGNFRARKSCFLWPYALFGDMDLEAYYWVQLGYHYDMTHGGVIDKCFADIENDIYKMSSTETAMNLDPVNACTLIFDFDKKGPNKDLGTQVYTYLLQDHKRYPQQKDFEDKLDDFYKECHKQFDEQTVIKKGKKKSIKVSAEYHIIMCKSEEELLTNIFKTINTFKPDVCEFWNMPYDMPKMRARMDMLGMNPVEMMSDSDFFPKNVQYANFHIDNRPIDIANRNSYIRMTSTTQYIDQMQNYASIRKGRKAYGSNKLDNIANIELGMGKWDFPKGVDVTNAAIVDYWDFVLYNIRDVWCQYLIDFVTNDTMSLIYDMNQHNCPLHLLGKQTKYQKQIYYKGYLQRGYVPGHNVNVHYTEFESEEEEERVMEARRRKALREALDRQGLDEDDIEDLMNEGDESVELALEYNNITKPQVVSENGDDTDIINDIVESETAKAYEENLEIFEDSTERKLPLPGGLVGNPDNNLARGSELIAGIESKHMFDDNMDEDYASEYPWAKYTRSLSRSTQIGRLIIAHKISDYQNLLPLGQVKRKEDLRNYIPGAEFTADYISQDFLSFGAVWFNLPLTDECKKLIDEMLKEEEEQS